VNLEVALFEAQRAVAELIIQREFAFTAKSGCGPLREVCVLIVPFAGVERLF